MNEARWNVCVEAIPHKYWYDVLMGFKTELLLMYVVFLVAVVFIIAIRTDRLNKILDDATSHQENMAEYAIDQYKAETDRLHRQEDDKDDE